MAAVFLRQDVTVTSHVKFIDNLLTLYHSELRLVRIGFGLLLCALISLFGAILLVVLG